MRKSPGDLKCTKQVARRAGGVIHYGPHLQDRDGDRMGPPLSRDCCRLVIIVAGGAVRLPPGMTKVGAELDRHFARIAVPRVIIVAGGAVRLMLATRCFHAPRWCPLGSAGRNVWRRSCPRA
jgi:hypothetical protein